MSTKPLTRNITMTFRAATDGDRAIGYGWYARARDLAVKMAHFKLMETEGRDYAVADFETEVRKAAGVIAALSPRLSWRKNVEYAELAYKVYKQAMDHPLMPRTGEVPEAFFASMLPTLNANARKAFRILSGQDPESVLGGPKVRAFYFTIVNPSDPRAVVIDRHAVSIAHNTPLTDEQIGKALGRKGAYDSVSELYRRASEIISRELGETWTPAQIQAATWTYWRRERALAYHGEA